MSWERGKLAFTLLLLQTLVLIVFSLYGSYSLEADASFILNSLTYAENGIDPRHNSIYQYLHGERTRCPTARGHLARLDECQTQLALSPGSQCTR